MRLSPAGAAGCLAAGLVSGAFWSLAPVAASNAGLDARGVAIFIGVTVCGGALSQWPFGRMSDRVDRRAVIAAAAGLSATAGILLFLATQHWAAAVLPLAFAFGAFTFPIFGLSVAHASDLIVEESFVEVSGGLLFLNGAGALLGPLAGGLAMRLAGPGALFVAIAVASFSLTVFVLIRMRKIARPAEMHRADSIAAVEAGITAPVNFDPRNEGKDVRWPS